MPWTSLTPILVWAILFVPFTVLLFRTPIKDRLTPLLLFLAYVAVNLYFFLAVNWALYNYWLRFLPIITSFFFLIRYFFFGRLHYRPWLLPRTRATTILRAAMLVVLAAFVLINIPVLRSYHYPSGTKVMAIYPLYTGMYVFVNAGNGLDGLAMNDSYRDWLGQPVSDSNWQAYASDIMELRTMGTVADRPKSDDMNAYEGGPNEPVYAPCVGVVVYKEFAHRDVRPYSEPSDPMGNRVVIQCMETDYYITVANLRLSQELVNVGQFVNFNNIIGYIGTSGTPAVPHIHIQANQGGWDENSPPVPIEFEFAFPVRNKLYVR
jgi:hypothetical protein